MDILELIQGRRSIRAYKPDHVSEDTLRSLVLDAGIWAPSGGNAQAWRFAIITNSELLLKIQLISPGLMGNAPAVIAICQDMAVQAHKGGDLGRDYLSITDSSMAAQNIMLAAHALGLGTCAIASLHRRGMQQILGLPAEIVPMLLLSVGIPAQPARAPTREKDVMWFNEYPKSAD